jgi:thiol-disulfide isomerase/thioredoxin
MKTILASLLCFAVVSPVLAALELGDAMPAFDLPGIDDKRHTDKEYADAEVLVLVFTCNHCPTAQSYEQRILKLHADYRDRNVALVAITPNDDKAVRLDEMGYTDLGDSLEETRIRAAYRGFTFPYLYDGETQAFSRQVGVLATPHVFVFDRDRKLRYTGRLDASESAAEESPDAERAIQDLLAGRPVATPRTRVFGCSTKWSENRSGVAEADAQWAGREVTLGVATEADIRTLAANEGERYLLVNVWATWCGPCITEFPELVKIQRMYERRRFHMATISLDKEPRHQAAADFLKAQQAAGMRNLRFNEHPDALAEALDPEWPGPVPYTLIIAPGGEIVHRHTGQFDPLALRRALSDLLGRTYASD